MKTCPICGRELRVWPLYRRPGCSPKRWAYCIRDMARLTAHAPHGWWDCPTCGRTRLEPHPRQPLLRCSNCKEHRR